MNSAAHRRGEADSGHGTISRMRRGAVRCSGDEPSQRTASGCTPLDPGPLHRDDAGEPAGAGRHPLCSLRSLFALGSIRSIRTDREIRSGARRSVLDQPEQLAGPHPVPGRRRLVFDQRQHRPLQLPPPVLVLVGLEPARLDRGLEEYQGVPTRPPARQAGQMGGKSRITIRFIRPGMSSSSSAMISGSVACGKAALSPASTR